MKNWNWTKNDDQNASRNNNVPAMQANRNMPAAVASYFGPLSHLYQDMDRMFDQAFRNFGLPSVFGVNALPGIQGMMFAPKVDISSTDREYTVEVEVPGIKEDDIRLDVTRDGQLCICGEKRLENDKQEKDFHRVERSYGSFTRTLSLPEDVDQENIEASFNNGVLTITAPRTQSQHLQTRRIEIGAGENRNEGPRNRHNRPEHGQDHGRQNRPEAPVQDNNRQNAAGSANPKRAA